MSRFADRVKDTTTTTGTGAITLAGSPPTGYVTFATGFGAVTTINVAYVIDGGTGEWEVGNGTFNGTTGLTRDTVRSSSNSNALVNFSAGTKNVFCTPSAEHIDNSNIGLILAQSRGWPMP
jgi:hypothetical protein